MRENTAYIRPPRALWVPFDLGRPLGAPHNAEFQMDVVRSALAIFERTDGPVILEDYPRDAPGQGADVNMEGLVCPVPLRKVNPKVPSELVANVLDETAKLAPWQSLFRETYKRTSVGVGNLDIPQSVQLLAELLENGCSRDIPDPELPRALRYASEDLRNFYFEAAAMRPGASPTSTELNNWFWGETSAGALLLAVQPICAKSPNAQLALVATRMLIPRAQSHRLEQSQ